MTYSSSLGHYNIPPTFNILEKLELGLLNLSKCINNSTSVKQYHVVNNQ